MFPKERIMQTSNISNAQNTALVSFNNRKNEITEKYWRFIIK